MILMVLLGGFLATLKGLFAGLAGAAIAVWTLPFLIFWSVFIIFCLVNAIWADRYWTSGVALFALFLLVFFTGDLGELAALVYHHPVLTTLIGVGYLAIGLAWVTFRWVRFIERMRPMRSAAIQRFLQNWEKSLRDYKSDMVVESVKLEGLDQVKINFWIDTLRKNGYAPQEPALLNKALNNHLLRRGDEDYAGRRDVGTATEPPYWSSNKRGYGAYFIYWPIDMLAYALGELLLDAWAWLSNAVQEKFNAYSRRRMFAPIPKSQDEGQS